MGTPPEHNTFEHIRLAGLERSVSIDIEAAADDIEAVAGLRLDDGRAYSSMRARRRVTMLHDLARRNLSTTLRHWR